MSVQIKVKAFSAEESKFIEYAHEEGVTGMRCALGMLFGDMYVNTYTLSEDDWNKIKKHY